MGKRFCKPDFYTKVLWENNIMKSEAQNTPETRQPPGVDKEEIRNHIQRIQHYEIAAQMKREVVILKAWFWKGEDSKTLQTDRLNSGMDAAWISSLLVISPATQEKEIHLRAWGDLRLGLHTGPLSSDGAAHCGLRPVSPTLGQLEFQALSLLESNPSSSWSLLLCTCRHTGDQTLSVAHSAWRCLWRH